MTLGPSFGAELIAAGLGGLPLTWGSDGDIQGRGRLTVQQNATLDAVIAAHDPNAYAAQQQAERIRLDDFINDPGQADLLARLKTATEAQIDTWLANNVTNLAQARDVLGTIIKFLVAKKLFR